MDSSRNSTRGFTLIEVMVVVFIMVMALSITIPAIYKALEKTKVKSFVRQTASTFRAARSDAIAKKSRIDVYINLRSNSLDIISRKSTKNNSLEESGKTDTLPGPKIGPTMSFFDDDQGNISAQTPYKIIGFKRHDQTKMQEEGTVIITFHPSGSCDGGEVFIQGPQENVFFVIAIDPMTGQIAVSQERSLYR